MDQEPRPGDMKHPNPTRRRRRARPHATSHQQAEATRRWRPAARRDPQRSPRPAAPQPPRRADRGREERPETHRSAAEPEDRVAAPTSRSTSKKATQRTQRDRTRQTRLQRRDRPRPPGSRKQAVAACCGAASVPANPPLRGRQRARGPGDQLPRVDRGWMVAADRHSHRPAVLYRRAPSRRRWRSRVAGAPRGDAAAPESRPRLRDRGRRAGPGRAQPAVLAACRRTHTRPAEAEDLQRRQRNPDHQAATPLVNLLVCRVYGAVGGLPRISSCQLA